MKASSVYDEMSDEEIEKELVMDELNSIHVDFLNNCLRRGIDPDDADYEAWFREYRGTVH